MVLGLILNPDFTRGDERRLRVRCGEIDQPEFRGLMIVRGDVAKGAGRMKAD